MGTSFFGTEGGESSCFEVLVLASEVDVSLGKFSVHNEHRNKFRERSSTGNESSIRFAFVCSSIHNRDGAVEFREQLERVDDEVVSLRMEGLRVISNASSQTWASKLRKNRLWTRCHSWGYKARAMLTRVSGHRGEGRPSRRLPINLRSLPGC